MSIEKRFIEKTSNGDMAAFKIVFEHYYPVVRAFILRIVRDVYLAEEIAQNVFIRIWLKRAILDPEKNFDNLIYTFSKHEISDYFRSEARYLKTLRLDMMKDLKQTQEIISSSFDVSSIKESVLKEMDKMPPQRQKVFRMSRIEGYSNDRIAKEMNLSIRTVERHLNLALKMIRAKLGELICWLTVFIFLE